MLETIRKSMEQSVEKIETKKIDFEICEICESKNFWQPRKSDEWLCSRCHPPRSESLIAQKRGPQASVAEPQDEAQHLAGFRMLQAQSWGPYIVNHEKPICECGCSWTEELESNSQVKNFCVRCRKQIFGSIDDGFFRQADSPIDTGDT